MRGRDRKAARSTLPRYWMGVAAVASIAACSKLDLGGGSGPIPTPTASTTPTSGPTPAACGTPNANTNTVLVAMGNIIGPFSAPPYGTINGYSVVEQGQFPGQAMLINQWMNPVGTVGPITTTNLLQFVNVDSTNTAHSAVGFKGEAFPQVPYTFPKAVASPTATAVSTTQLWSTGRISPFLGSVPCYSQTFSLSKGIYYFGDLDYYNLSNFRNVLIVNTPSPNAWRARFARSI